MPRRVEFGKDGLKVKGQKMLPICGEFHYWRVDPKWWNDVLGRLFKDAEMTIVASYIPWSVHEPIRDRPGQTDPRIFRAALIGL